jgi:hypothetical protein
MRNGPTRCVYETPFFYPYMNVILAAVGQGYPIVVRAVVVTPLIGVFKTRLSVSVEQRFEPPSLQMQHYPSYQ